jgi:hypothetical protein
MLNNIAPKRRQLLLKIFCKQLKIIKCKTANVKTHNEVIWVYIKISCLYKFLHSWCDNVC